MCGLTACLAFEHAATNVSTVKAPREKLNREIHESLEIVKHRGPDARGQWVSADGRVGLGHVRLSIIDLSREGNQPFHDEEDTVHAIVNGELYDHERYRADLAKDYKFKGQSDCEIVIALYKQYGLSLLPHLRGEFAFVIWDEKRQLLFAARDRYGIKSLYYTVVGGRLLVATEIKSFLAFGWQPEWDITSIVEGGFNHDHRTMFKHVYKVLPGHYLLNKKSIGTETQPYWDLEYPDKNIVDNRTEDEMIAGIRERLIEAVRLRLRADVPVGIFLSGGLDSSSIAGITAQLIKEGKTAFGDDASRDVSRMKCFTVQFDQDSGVDESAIARRTAEFLGVDFVPVPVTEQVIADKFEDVAWHSETAAPDANGMGRLALAEKVHELGLKVVLTGEGSDEHFGGYGWFLSDVLREADPSYPSSESNHLTPQQRDSAVLKATEKTKIFSDKAVSRPAATSRMLNGIQGSELQARSTPVALAPWVLETPQYNDVQTPIVESFDGRTREAIMSKWHPLHTSQYVWTRTSFVNILLRHIGDNVDMVHHVESRTPFLDHHLTQYANALPPSLKVKFDPATGRDNEKYLLKEAMRPFITDEIYQRKKWPFLGPFKYPKDGPMHRMFARVITRENVENLGFLDWSRIEGLVDRVFEKKDPYAFREACVVAQFITIGRRFGVRTAREEPGWSN